jgi:DNA (cytosine-5)-methyltransferase 1
VRDAIGALPAINAGEVSPGDPIHRTAGHRPETLATIRAVPRDGGNRPVDVGPDSLRRIRERQGRGGYDDVYGRLRWDRPSITITAYSRNPASGRYVHPVQDRGLSIREAALLQGFPRSYQFTGTLDEAFRQIGNAVPPTFAACLAGHVLNELAKPLAEGAPEATGIQAPVGPSFARLIAGLKAGHLSLTPSGVENVDGGRSRRLDRPGKVRTAGQVAWSTPLGG